MSNKVSGFGCYSPLKKRPGMPPSEFFKVHDNSSRNNKRVAAKSMKPKELAMLCYGHFDGRSNLAMKP